jgi:hypothetical protein
MMMLDVIGLVRVAERHPDRFDFRLAEIFEHERFDAGLGFDSLVEVAAPPVGTQLPRPENENIAANYFDAFHKTTFLTWNGRRCGNIRINYLAELRQNC